VGVPADAQKAEARQEGWARSAAKMRLTPHPIEFSEFTMIAMISAILACIFSGRGAAFSGGNEPESRKAIGPGIE